MVAAAILKNQKIAILQAFEHIIVNCKSNAHWTSEPQLNCHTSVLLVHFKLYDYAVYCAVRICSMVNSDTIFQLDGTSKQKYR